IDMAYKIDPTITIFSVDTGRLPQETHDLIAQLRAHYPGLNLDLVKPEPVHVERMVSRRGLDLFQNSVEDRLLCCNIRKVQPLTKVLHGLDAWITGLRRDQWATRTNIRKVEIDHDHGAIVKLNPLAAWTRMASAPVKLAPDAAEVALGETQAVLAYVQDDEKRGRLADLGAAIADGELGDDEAQALEEFIELGLSTGRIRGLYGPEGEQAALKTYRKLPRGKEVSGSAREVTQALATLEGKTLENVSVQSAGPGAYLVSIGVEGLELSVRLDRSGARLHSVGV